MIEIIPKPAKKIPGWQTILLYFSLGLVVVVVLIYASLFYFEGKASTVLQNLEDAVNQVGSQQEKAQEAEIFIYQRKIEDFSKLFSQRQKPLNFFQFIEETCHPQVEFSGLALSLDVVQASLFGKSADFQTLGQQLFIFQNHDLIKDVKLSELAIGDEGGVEFSLSLSFDPRIFK